MKPLWTLADLVDLHYFFQLDETVRRTAGEAALVKRDRMIYLAKIEPQLGRVEEVPHRLLVRKWLTMRRLQHRRDQDEGAPLPGAVWREVTVLSRVLIFLCALAAGFGLAGSLLFYTGTTPVNVAVYLGLFVGLQLVVLAVQGLLLGYRRLRRIPMESTVVYLFVGRALLRILDGLRRRVARTMTGTQRLDLAALAGSIRQRKELAALLIWPAFILAQLGGIGFNLGVIVATLAKVAFADIAFAWQSSLSITADLIASLVRWVALPWSWAVDHGYPGLAQIEGSQMVLKEGMAHLASGDLVAWWPFLVWAVAVYGLAPRCLLLVLGALRQRRALEQLHFATLAIRPLIQRMTAPRLDTVGHKDGAGPRAAQSAHPVTPTATGPAVTAPIQPATAAEPYAGSGRLILLLPDELADADVQSALVDLLAPMQGARIEWLRHGVPGVSDEESLAPVGVAAAEGSLDGVMVVQEAWQPPLRETGHFLRILRQMAGETTTLTLLLVGRPQGAEVLTPVDAEAERIWRLNIQALGDPRIEVRPLVHS